jgi:hypothetical protein
MGGVRCATGRHSRTNTRPTARGCTQHTRARTCSVCCCAFSTCLFVVDAARTLLPGFSSRVFCHGGVGLQQGFNTTSKAKSGGDQPMRVVAPLDAPAMGSAVEGRRAAATGGSRRCRSQKARVWTRVVGTE